MQASTTAEEAISEAVHRIATQFTPEKIILFGSHARGEAHNESDADFLIVMKNVQGRKRQTATQIDLALMGVPIATDLIVVTPEDIEKHRNMRGTVIYEAMREGLLLYDAAA